MRWPTLLRTVFFASLVAAAALASGCELAVWGNGDGESETRSLDGFSAIVLSAGIDVQLDVRGEGDGPPERAPARAPVATLRCDENLLRRIETIVDGDTLHVYVEDDRTLRPRTPCELVLSTTTLTHARIEGPGSLVIGGTLDELRTIEVEGPAELDADGIAVAELAVDIEGPADVALAGHVDALAIALEGPLSLDAEDLVARALELDASGPLDAAVRATERCTLDVEGPASVDVHGHPDVRELEIDGPADVDFR